MSNVSVDGWKEGPVQFLNAFFSSACPSQTLERHSNIQLTDY